MCVCVCVFVYSSELASLLRCLPVSYTHLDVYKRQNVDMMETPHRIFISVSDVAIKEELIVEDIADNHPVEEVQ